jgi:RNA polymerase-binding transcription factor DksA
LFERQMPAPLGVETYEERVLHRICSNKEGRVLEEDYPQDLGHHPVMNLSRELLFQQSTHRRQLLRKVEVALERIREGTFGECTSCREQISVRRCEAMPFAVYCRDCQESLARERVRGWKRAPTLVGVNGGWLLSPLPSPDRVNSFGRRWHTQKSQDSSSYPADVMCAYCQSRTGEFNPERTLY